VGRKPCWRGDLIVYRQQVPREHYSDRNSLRRKIHNLRLRRLHQSKPQTSTLPVTPKTSNSITSGLWEQKQAEKAEPTIHECSAFSACSCSKKIQETFDSSCLSRLRFQRQHRRIGPRRHSRPDVRHPAPSQCTTKAEATVTCSNEYFSRSPSLVLPAGQVSLWISPM